MLVAIASWEGVGWAALAPLYAALSFTLLAAAYIGVGPGLLLKQADGRRPALAWVLFAPYFLMSTAAFHLYRLLSREPAYAEAAPNLFFGRRLTARESAAAGWESILDLAAEAPAARVTPGYWSLPVLDASPPTEVEARAAVAWIAERVASGPVYIHCALGHGRSVTVVIAYLLSVGAIDSASEGVRRLRALRPGVWLHRPQLDLLRRFEPPAH